MAPVCLLEQIPSQFTFLEPQECQGDVEMGQEGETAQTH